MRSGLEILQRSGRDVGWLYLAVVLDLYSRRVIGWAMAATQDEALIERAFQMTLLARHPPAGVLFHSDRGSQDTSDAYQAVLANVGAEDNSKPLIRQDQTRIGSPDLDRIIW
jgi:transposase InsO family protein